MIRGRGGTGRRAALRSLWGKTRGSSSLLGRTINHIFIPIFHIFIAQSVPYQNHTWDILTCCRWSPAISPTGVNLNCFCFAVAKSSARPFLYHD